MKIRITLLFLMFSLYTIAQEKGFEKILLDGKEAYLNKTTGEIKYPESKKKTKVNDPKTNDYLVTDNRNHSIQKGETLFSLSRKYNVHIDEICKTNNLTRSSIISIGQQIKIPNLNNSNFHIVEKGQSLYFISRKYGLTVGELKNLNDLNSNKILIGQKLILE